MHQCNLIFRVELRKLFDVEIIINVISNVMVPKLHIFSFNFFYIDTHAFKKLYLNKNIYVCDGIGLDIRSKTEG